LNKAPDAFRTISEVAEELDLPQHVLRFWESRFPHIRPMKRGGGRRYYRPEDVDLLRGIRHLLYADGYTIRGVQRILREQGVRTVQSVGQGLLRLPEPGPEDDPAPLGALADADLPVSYAQAERHRQGDGYRDNGDRDRMNEGDLNDADLDRGDPDEGDSDSSNLDGRDEGEPNTGPGVPEHGSPDHTASDPIDIERGAAAAVAMTSPNRAHHAAASRGSPPAPPPATNSHVAAPDASRPGMAPLDLERLKAALAELESCRRLLDRAIDGA
jgi:DNA-binding transcriptional MerR regulator